MAAAAVVEFGYSAVSSQEQEQCSQQEQEQHHKQHARITISSKHINSFII